MMNPTIRTESLTKRFGRTTAVDGISLTVPEGSIYALVGANGAGKTTLIKMFMNILRPNAGSAQVLGIESARLSGKALNRIGYVSENQELPEGMTVGGMLDYLRGFYPTWDTALEQQLVRQFDLPVRRKLKHLSRGMKMKAAFAGSLAYRPSLIILDEPFSGLDPLVRDELIEGLIERAPETTIFLSSHDLSEIESFSSHVGYLQNGRLLFSEEMTVLGNRFRDVTVTVNEPTALPAKVPAAWLEAQTVDCVVRFVHSDFKDSETQRELAERFPGARNFEFEPMTLRQIFLAIAKTGRGAAIHSRQDSTRQEKKA
jgi:ABC-2 type transport system ATP-binding protein